MDSSLGAVLERRRAEGFVGRERELSLLDAILTDDGPVAAHIHGLAGMGKSSLLEAFARRAAAQGAAVILLDCGSIEPTETGFLLALRTALGIASTDATAVSEGVGALGPRVVLGLDRYEVFGLLDVWLRQTFLPGLGDHVRFVFSGRQPPLGGWMRAPEWRGLLTLVELGPLDERAALQLLALRGVEPEAARRIQTIVKGHPLALTLAASSTHELGAEPEDIAVQTLVDTLARNYLVGIEDPLTRDALTATSVLRRVTEPLLSRLMPDAAPREVADRIRALPFVSVAQDGLVVHDAVRHAIAAALKASDPARYRDYQRRAWELLRLELARVAPADLWRYTADIIYLLENPIIRNAFFPADWQPIAVEPAKAGTGEAIMEVAALHEGQAATSALAAWWEFLPSSFYVARDQAGAIAGFVCLAEADSIDAHLLERDPILKRWMEHWTNSGSPKGRRALFVRRWLSIQEGELPSPVQAAIWLDAKRTYLSLRPELCSVYLTVVDLETYAPAATKLGFVPFPEAPITLDGRPYYSAVLNFGPGSVDGWIERLVGAELGVDHPAVIDRDAHELVLHGVRVPLTPLEFQTLAYLESRRGEAVSRANLLSAVWGYEFDGGSNVDSAVIRSLRKKLGSDRELIETVRGVGYRMRR